MTLGEVSAAAKARAAANVGGDNLMGRATC
jgi:hypothetical protein